MRRDTGKRHIIAASADLVRDRRAFLAASLCTGAGLLAPRIGWAADDYPLLQGKNATILVGSEVGGNSDLFARSIARHFERVIPSLRIEIKNVPQASGALAAKTLQSGPTDGTMLLSSSTGLLSAQVEGDESVQYDLAQWAWLGRLATETRLLIRGPGADFANLDELRAKTTPSPLPVRAKTSFTYAEAIWLNSMLGLRINPVPGYKATERNVALVQGEVMLAVVGYPTDREVVENPGVDVVLRMTDGPALPERFADRPLLADLIAGKPSLAGIAKLMKACTSMQNWMAAPPGTPPEILAEWRRAFDAAAGSAEYLDESAKLGFSVSLVQGAALSQQIGDLVASIPALRLQLDAASRCGEELAAGQTASCAIL